MPFFNRALFRSTPAARDRRPKQDHALINRVVGAGSSAGVIKCVGYRTRKAQSANHQAFRRPKSGRRYQYYGVLPGRHAACIPAMIVTAIFTRLRCSELRGLGWEHVDFVEKVTQVHRRRGFP